MLRRAVATFCVTFAVAVTVTGAVMTVASVSKVVAGSASLAARPSDRVAAITDRSAGPVPSFHGWPAP
jgi:hypothetical protein